jgi:hypothetical protein
MNEWTWTKFDVLRLRFWLGAMELIDRCGGCRLRIYDLCLNEAKPLMAKHARWWMGKRGHS